MQLSVLEIIINISNLLIIKILLLFNWVLKIFKIFKYFQNLRRQFLGVKIVRYDWSDSGGFRLV